MEERRAGSPCRTVNAMENMISPTTATSSEILSLRRPLAESMLGLVPTLSSSDDGREEKAMISSFLSISVFAPGRVPEYRYFKYRCVFELSYCRKDGLFMRNGIFNSLLPKVIQTTRVLTIDS